MYGANRKKPVGKTHSSRTVRRAVASDELERRQPVQHGEAEHERDVADDVGAEQPVPAEQPADRPREQRVEREEGGAGVVGAVALAGDAQEPQRVEALPRREQVVPALARLRRRPAGHVAGCVARQQRGADEPDEQQAEADPEVDLRAVPQRAQPVGARDDDLGGGHRGRRLLLRRLLVDRRHPTHRPLVKTSTSSAMSGAQTATYAVVIQGRRTDRTARPVNSGHHSRVARPTDR